MSIVKLSNRGVRNVSEFGSLAPGSMVFIKKVTASSDGDISFVDGTSDVVLDDTYKEYIFTYNNMHPSADAAKFLFQGNAAGGSGYNETITSTFFYAYVKESDGSDGTLMYNTGRDLAQSTSFHTISADDTGTDNDLALSGYLHLFNPSSTTFVKHFISRVSNPNASGSSTYMCDCYSAGYFNTTSAIDEIQFKFASGNIDAGDICLYGIL